MRPQATGSNPLSGSIICPSVGPSGRPRAFYDFMSVCLVVRGPFWTRINASRRWTPTLQILIQIHFQFGGPASRCIYCVSQCQNVIETVFFYPTKGIRRRKRFLTLNVTKFTNFTYFSLIGRVIFTLSGLNQNS